MRPVRGLALVATAALATAAASSAQAATRVGGSATVGPERVEHAVGTTTERLVDRTRPTPRSGDTPRRPARVLVTSIWYPAQGASNTVAEGAPPDTADGPYPLIVFSHGLGATPDVYAPLLTALAAAGNVVAAPSFPLSSARASGRPDAGDVANQPGDVSFVIDRLLAASKQHRGPLAGLIRRDAIGVAGHSNGAITTLGVIAHGCCRDRRVKAAAVLAGVPAPFPHGHYDFADMPPMLAVHGTDDSLVSYDEMARTFNRARTPKVFLTVEGGDHGSPTGSGGPSSASVLRTITDFFSGYLRHDRAALRRLSSDAEPGVTSIVVATAPGSDAKVDVAPAPELDRRVAVTPDRGLEGGQVVTVRWRGFSPGGVVNIVQCGPDRSAGAAGCDLTKAQILHPDPTGEGEVTLEIVEGPVGTATCDARHPGCTIVANDDGSQLPDSTVRAPITFAK